MSLALVKKSPGGRGVLIWLRTGMSKEWTGFRHEVSKGFFGLPAMLARGRAAKMAPSSHHFP